MKREARDPRYYLRDLRLRQDIVASSNRWKSLSRSTKALFTAAAAGELVSESMIENALDDLEIEGTTGRSRIGRELKLAGLISDLMTPEAAKREPPHNDGWDEWSIARRSFLAFGAGATDRLAGPGEVWENPILPIHETFGPKGVRRLDSKLLDMMEPRRGRSQIQAVAVVADRLLQEGAPVLSDEALKRIQELAMAKNPRKKKAKKRTKGKTKKKAKKFLKKAKKAAKTKTGRAGIGAGAGALLLGPIGAVGGALYGASTAKKNPRNPPKNSPPPVVRVEGVKHIGTIQVFDHVPGPYYPYWNEHTVASWDQDPKKPVAISTRAKWDDETGLVVWEFMISDYALPRRMDPTVSWGRNQYRSQEEAIRAALAIVHHQGFFRYRSEYNLPDPTRSPNPKKRKKNPEPQIHIAKTYAKTLLLCCGSDPGTEAFTPIDLFGYKVLRGEKVPLSLVIDTKNELERLEKIQTDKMVEEEIEGFREGLEYLIEQHTNPARAFSLETEVKRSRQKKAKKAALSSVAAEKGARSARAASVRRTLASLNPPHSHLKKCREAWEKYCASPTKRRIQACHKWFEKGIKHADLEVRKECRRGMRACRLEMREWGLKPNPSYAEAMMMDVTKEEAIREIMKNRDIHGMSRAEATKAFFAFAGEKDEYEGEEVLAWLGY